MMDFKRASKERTFELLKIKTYYLKSNKRPFSIKDTLSLASRKPKMAVSGNNRGI